MENAARSRRREHYNTMDGVLSIMASGDRLQRIWTMTGRAIDFTSVLILVDRKTPTSVCEQLVGKLGVGGQKS
jgi:hypothetical protein